MKNAIRTSIFHLPLKVEKRKINCFFQGVRAGTERRNYFTPIVTSNLDQLDARWMLKIISLKILVKSINVGYTDH